MWISTTTINLISLKSDLEFLLDPTFGNKKQELQQLDGAGLSVPGWETPEWINSGQGAPEDVDSITIKRSWNTEQNARAFSDLVTTAFGVHSTSTVEEQV